VDTLLHIGLSNAAVAAVLALALALAKPLWRRRPALAHCLWLLVLVKLVTPSFLAVPMPWPEPAPAEPPLPALDLPLRVGEPDLLLAEDLAIPVSQAPILAPPGPTSAVAATHEPGAPGWAWKETVYAIWLTGALAWWSLSAWRIASFARSLRSTASAAPEVQALAQRLARQLGLSRCPQVRLAADAISPLLWAVGRV